MPLGALAVGVLLETVSSTATVLATACLMLVVAVAALLSRAVRDAPVRA